MHATISQPPCRGGLSAVVPIEGGSLAALRMFDVIPNRHFGAISVDGVGAAPLLKTGEVAVYEQYDPYAHDLIDGGLYVIEYQSTRAGASPELFARWYVEHRATLIVRRSIVRMVASRQGGGLWRAISLDGSTSLDGDLPASYFLDRIIGVVVGLYRGSAA